MMVCVYRRSINTTVKRTVLDVTGISRGRERPKKLRQSS